MAYRDGLQSSRFEMKYLIDEARAAAIRDFVLGYLEPDEHAEPGMLNSYAVYSLYLDSPALVLFRQTVQGLKNRFKLRIRFYDAHSDHPAYLEIKRRTTDVIVKRRAAISRTGIRRFLESGWLDGRELVASNGFAKAAAAAAEFGQLRDMLGAGALIYVAYRREAYVSRERSHVRVTLDREVRGASYDPGAGLAPPRDGTPAALRGVVLELKFTDRFPQWMCELVQAFQLERRSVPKYVECVQAMGLHLPGVKHLVERPHLMMDENGRHLSGTEVRGPSQDGQHLAGAKPDSRRTTP